MALKSCEAAHRVPSFGTVADSEAALKSAADRRRDIVNVLTAEHSNLQAARSAGVAEMTGRTTSFFAALSGALVALALVSQVETLRDVLLLVALSWPLRRRTSG